MDEQTVDKTADRQAARTEKPTQDAPVPAGDAAQDAALTPCLVVSREKNGYRLATPGGDVAAVVSGRFRYDAAVAADFPSVGDNVLADLTDGVAVIHRVLPRKSVFLRREAGTTQTGQVVAANIDTLFLCMSLGRDFNLRRLERYLAAAWESGAVPVVVLTKADLCTDSMAQLAAAERVAMGADVRITSALDADGIDCLAPYLGKGKTVAFVGSSGVGKSTLINRLLGEDRLSTGGLRKDGRGRHTTTRRELLPLPGGGAVIDTPGMREFGLLDAEEGIGRSFADVETLAAACRFRNCTHTGEPGCAVQTALADGTLPEARWLSYRKLHAENRYAADSSAYLEEKRQKFRTISKINKADRRRKDDCI